MGATAAAEQVSPPPDAAVLEWRPRRLTSPYDSPSESDGRTWWERAACRDEDPELFFPIGTTGRALDQIDRATAVCRRCPVIEQCLDYAVRTGQDDGIWGGLTPEERRVLRGRAARRRLNSLND